MHLLSLSLMLQSKWVPARSFSFFSREHLKAPLVGIKIKDMPEEGGRSKWGLLGSQQWTRDLVFSGTGVGRNRQEGCQEEC